MKNGIPHLSDITELLIRRGFREQQLLKGLTHLDESPVYVKPSREKGCGYWRLTPLLGHDLTFLSVYLWGADEKSSHEDCSIVFSATSDGVVKRVTFCFDCHRGSDLPDREGKAVPTTEAELDQLILEFRTAVEELQ